MVGGQQQKAASQQWGDPSLLIFLIVSMCSES